MIFASAENARPKTLKHNMHASPTRPNTTIALSEEFFKRLSIKSKNITIIKKTDCEKIISFKKDDGIDMYAISWLDEKKQRTNFALINKKDEILTKKLAFDCDDEKSVMETISATKDNFWRGSYVETYMDLNNGLFHMSLALEDASYVTKIGTLRGLLLYVMLDGMLSSGNALGVALGTIMELTNIKVSNSNYSMNISIDCVN